MNKEQKVVLIRIIVSAVLTLTLQFVPVYGIIKFLLYLIPYLVVGCDVLLEALEGIGKGEIFDENFLMAIATVGALTIGFTRSGDYSEAVLVMLLYQIGELFQSCAVGKSKKNITELMDIRPDSVALSVDGEIKRVAPKDVKEGSVITVMPGERVALDGVIMEGKTSLDTSALTGESLPRDVQVGDEILSGCINMSSVIKLRTTKPFADSTLCKILDLVENATRNKSKSENFVSKFSKIYTPAVCAVAFLIATVPPIFSAIILKNPTDFIEWLYRALSFLVISCPCALVIGIPLTFFSAIGGAGKSGILIKGSNFIETLSKTGCVVFDKTGTLTKGNFDVVKVCSERLEDSQLVEYVAHAEGYSSHPISKSILKFYGKEISKTQVSDITEISGEGITAKIYGKFVIAGNSKLMQRFDIAYKKADEIGTVIYVAIDNSYEGYIVISDTVKDNSKAALTQLRKLGVKKTVMLTGDRYKAANSVAEEVGIDSVYAELLPGDKLSKVNELLEEKDDKIKLAFVGDGINDAPVIAGADIGIAMGLSGSDSAIEAADVVLMDDDPLKLSKAIKISKKCMRIVYQNCLVSISIKLLCLILTAMGMADMWLAVLADVGVMLLAVLNAIRALLVKKL